MLPLTNGCEFATCTMKGGHPHYDPESYRHSSDLCRYYVRGDGCRLYTRIPRVCDVL